MVLVKLLVSSLLFASLMSFQIGPITDCEQVKALVTAPNDDLDPLLSPDGSQIAFVGHHEGNPDVYVQEIATGTIRNLSNMPEDDYRPLWSPDGNRLAAELSGIPSREGGEVVATDIRTGAIYRYSAGEKTIYVVSHLQWTPDSHNLIFSEYLPGRLTRADVMQLAICDQ
jgi:dipeptidyl aminopeptidase/acylaminoacyl peptidase